MPYKHSGNQVVRFSVVLKVGLGIVVRMWLIKALEYQDTPAISQLTNVLLLIYNILG